MKRFPVKKSSFGILVLLISFLLLSCVKPQYQTAEGKKKYKKYNSVQYPKQPGTIKNKRNSTKF